MASSGEIRRRIKSVTSVQHITKAMKMVAAARLRRAQEKANASRPYADKIKELLARVVEKVENLSHPLLETREVKNIAYFIVSADKGLAGAYSTNLMKEAMSQISVHEEVPKLVTIGRKSCEYFSRRGYKIDNQYSGFSERPTYEEASAIANEMTSKFTSGEYDEVYVVYTKFFTPLNYQPTTIRVLPVEPPEKKDVVENKDDLRDYIFEPSPEEALRMLVPLYLERSVYASLIQSAASELGARMAAMGSATDNARDLISSLVLHYNKVRQAGITREISEIVGGAESLK